MSSSPSVTSHGRRPDNLNDVAEVIHFDTTKLLIIYYFSFAFRVRSSKVAEKKTTEKRTSEFKNSPFLLHVPSANILPAFYYYSVPSHF